MTNNTEPSKVSVTRKFDHYAEWSEELREQRLLVDQVVPGLTGY